MICPNCKATIKDSIKVCNYCGEKTDTVEKEDYLKEYIGTNYEIIKKGQFSLLALLFGPLLLLFYRIWVLSILLIGFIGLIYYYNPEIAIFSYLMINLFLGFRFNTLYYEYAKKKVDEIKISNPEKSSKELLELCKTKGKPFFPTTILLFGLMIIIGMILPYLLFVEKEKPIPEEQKVFYLSYTIPKDFIASNNNNNFYRHYYYTDENNNCSVTITEYHEKSIDSYMKKYYKDLSFSKEEIQNWNWRIVNNGNNLDYLIEINSDIYKVRFKSQGEICEKRIEEIKNSLNFPEIDQ